MRPASGSTSWSRTCSTSRTAFGPFPFFLDRGCYHAVRAIDVKAYLRTLKKITAEGSIGLVLTGNAKEPPPEGQGPPVVSEEEIRAELGSLFEIIHLREFRFDVSEQLGTAPLAWSCLLRRGGGRFDELRSGRGWPEQAKCRRNRLIDRGHRRFAHTRLRGLGGVRPTSVSVQSNTLVGQTRNRSASYGRPQEDRQGYHALGLSVPASLPQGAIRTLIFEPRGLFHPEGRHALGMARRARRRVGVLQVVLVRGWRPSSRQSGLSSRCPLGRNGSHALVRRSVPNGKLAARQAMGTSRKPAPLGHGPPSGDCKLKGLRADGVYPRVPVLRTRVSTRRRPSTQGASRAHAPEPWDCR